MAIAAAGVEAAPGERRSRGGRRRNAGKPGRPTIHRLGRCASSCGQPRSEAKQHYLHVAAPFLECPFRTWIKRGAAAIVAGGRHSLPGKLTGPR
jgi:hypothetical protein